MRALGGSQVAGEMGVAERGIRGVGSTAKSIAGVAGLGALAFTIKDVTQAAIGFQQQQSQVANALHQTGQYSKGAVSRLSEFSDQLSVHGGYDPTTTLAGIQRLIRAHDSVTQAMRDETLVTDIARSGSISYSSALRAVSILEQGRTTGLSRLGVVVTAVKTAETGLTASHQKSVDVMKELEAHGVKFTALQKLQYEQTHTLTAAELAHAKAQDQNATKMVVMNLLMHRFGGAAKAFSDSGAGAISNFTHQADILSQQLGKILLPAITFLAKAMGWVVQAVMDIVKWFGRNKDLTEALAITAGILATAWGVYTVATNAAAIGTGILSAAMFLLSNVPIVLAIAAIVAIVYLLIKHWGDLKAAAVDAWHWVETAATNAWHWIKHAGMDVWNWLKGVWHDAGHIVAFPFVWAWKSVIQPTGGWIIGAFESVVHWLSGAWQTMKHVVAAPFVAAFSTIKGVVVDVVNWLIDRVNGVISMINDVTSNLPFGLDFTIPLIGHLGSGSGSTMATAGANYAWAQAHGGVHLAPHTGTPGQPGYGDTQVPGTVVGPHGTHVPRGRQQFGGPIRESGIYRVGEMGVEHVYLPAGAEVVPHGGDGVPLENHIVLQVGPQQFAKVMNYSLAQQKASR